MAPKTTKKKVTKKKKNMISVKRMPSLAYDVKGAFGRFDDINPFPPRLPVKFTYTGHLQLTHTAGSTLCGTTYKYSLNNPFYPTTADSGVRPAGYDFLLSGSGPYARFKCNYVKFNVIATDPTIDSDQHLVMALHDPSGVSAGDTIASTNLAGIRAKSNCVAKFISSTGDQRKSITQSMPMYKLFNWSKDQYKNDMDNSTGAYNGSPGNLAQLEIGMLDPRAQNPAGLLQVSVTITYYCMLYSRIQL